MKRGDLYRVYRAVKTDPKHSRVFVIVSRQVLIDSSFSTVTCAPIYTKYDGLSTQVPVGPESGLKHDSSIHCDELIGIQKNLLTNYVGHLHAAELDALRGALLTALELDD